jgi:hypothetical protein
MMIKYINIYRSNKYMYRFMIMKVILRVQHFDEEVLYIINQSIEVLYIYNQLKY